MVRFLVSADWQLGMTRAFLDADAQARYSDARAEAIARLAEIAKTERCDFVVVAGDVFESNQVDNRTIERVLDRLQAFDVPVYLLPGNHDPLDPSSIYGEKRLAGRLPEQIHVLRDVKPIVVAPGVEVVGAPWRTKNPAFDPTLEALDTLAATAPGVVRVLVGHGAVDECIDTGQVERAPIALATLERAIETGQVHFIALGDRHSKTRVGETGRIWYPGTPETTRFDEVDPGHALVVSLEFERVEVQPVKVGRWRFLEHAVELHGQLELENLKGWFSALGAVDRVVLRLRLFGDLPVTLRSELENWLDQRRSAFACLEVDVEGLHTTLTKEDVDALELKGLALQTANVLRERAALGRAEARTAEDALCLLARLVKEME